MTTQKQTCARVQLSHLRNLAKTLLRLLQLLLSWLALTQRKSSPDFPLSCTRGTTTACTRQAYLSHSRDTRTCIIRLSAFWSKQGVQRIPLLWIHCELQQLTALCKHGKSGMHGLVLDREVVLYLSSDREIRFQSTGSFSSLGFNCSIFLQCKTFAMFV